MVAMNRTYNDYKQSARWTEAGVYFVTRMKDNALYEVFEEREVPLYRGHSKLISSPIISFERVTRPKYNSSCIQNEN